MRNNDNPADTYECDALVVGTGAAGLSAAVTASHRGLALQISPSSRGRRALMPARLRQRSRHSTGTQPRVATPPSARDRAPIIAIWAMGCTRHARALDADGGVIKGLYAAGNDMESIMGGNYPGVGITLGPALTFGYIAGKHVAGR